MESNDFRKVTYLRPFPKPGIYRYLSAKRGRTNGKWRHTTINYYLVRVPTKEHGLTRGITVGKYKTEEEARAAFLNNCPDWEGEIPYYEDIQPYMKKRYKAKNKNSNEEE